MATRWSDWVHVMWSARGQWLPADARGFRDHDHRTHSSGDYRKPPPPEEHAGLRRFAASATRVRIVLPVGVRPAIADALSRKWAGLHTKTRIIAVDGVHAHALIQVGDTDAKPFVARAKQFASHQIHDRMPGSIWAQGCRVVRVDDETHWRTTVDYIAKHALRGATFWEPEQFRARSESEHLQ